MSNRAFLYLWFPLSWAITAAVSLFVVRLLRAPVLDLGSNLGVNLRRFLRVAFPAGIIVPVFSAFLSVSYFELGCGGLKTATDVIASPDQLHNVAQHEMAAISGMLIYVLFGWALIYTILLVTWKQTRLPA
jgi:hypothetical protein